jgi:type II secretory pathway pseudopilin PulG
MRQFEACENCNGEWGMLETVRVAHCSKMDALRCLTKRAKRLKFKVRHSPFQIPHASNSAFTFVEILAALLFLAILVPVVTEALTIANRASVVAERSAIAGELAENKLNDIILTNAWSSSETQGDFGDDWPNYRWKLTQTQRSTDAMTELKMEVFFPVQGRDRSVSLSTLASLSGTSSSSSGASTNSTISTNSSSSSR